MHIKQRRVERLGGVLLRPTDRYIQAFQMTVRDNYRLGLVVECTARWPLITLRLYWRETLDGRCIHKFIMPSSRTETESESQIFLTKPAETDRLQDFENRNNTNNKSYHLMLQHCYDAGWHPMTGLCSNSSQQTNHNSVPRSHH